MHPVALATYSTSGDEVRAYRIILRQIGREVHLLPLELLAQLLLAREAELTEVPASDEVDLPVYRLLIDLIRMCLHARLDRLGE